MAENTSSGSGATPWLAFLVGGLIVVVAVIGYLVYSGQTAAPKKTLDVNISAPAVPAPAAPASGG